jgi:hypothetical protein
MSIKKEQILYNNLDNHIKFNLKSDDNFYSYQEEIDNLTNLNGFDILNPVIDSEKCKFKYQPNSTMLLKFNFYNSSGIYGNSFLNAGFTSNEINKNNNFLNSFFILEFYDTYDINIQTKIFTNYLTKLGTQPSYEISNNSNQFYYFYIPQSFINSQTGTTITGYTKFSFYNAKVSNDRISLFYNNTINNDTPEKMFFKTSLNLTGKTWNIISNNNNISIYEYNNNDYKNKINETFTQFNNVKQVFPNGNTFNYANGSYSTT